MPKKTSVSRPTHKKRQRNDLIQYRPITRVPARKKVIEKYVASYLNELLEHNKLINMNHLGFQKSKRLKTC